MICIAGKNDIAVNILDFVVARYGADEVVAIPNRNDMGIYTWQSSLIVKAKQLSVRVISLDEAYDIPSLHFFSVEFDRIVIPSRFRHAELYNIHFSLLPKYKGVYTAVWPVRNGDTETGVTLHRMEIGIDTGAIIHQESFPIGLHDNARDVYHTCLAVGYKTLCQFIPQLVISPVAGVPQSMVGSTYYGPKSIDYSNLIIDLRQTAYQIHNTVRAFTFQEYQLPEVLGRRIRASNPTTDISNTRPGLLLEEDAKGFLISTIDFNLYFFKDYSIELFKAVELRDARNVQELVSHVDDLEVRNIRGWTPLMIAAYHGDLSVAAILVGAGANINAINKKGTSVLMYAKTAASNSGELELMKFLLANGADANAVDIMGKSVIDYARTEGNVEVRECLSNWITK